MQTVNEALSNVFEQMDRYIQAWSAFGASGESHLSGRITAMQIAKLLVKQEFDKVGDEEDLRLQD